jgi:hypothetical protein
MQGSLLLQLLILLVVANGRLSAPRSSSELHLPARSTAALSLSMANPYSDPPSMWS